MANRDLEAFHAIEAALIDSGRARGNGKPSYQTIARRFLYLWPGGKVDNLRKNLERHYLKHLIDKMQEAREEEKEVTRGLNEIADEFINLCLDNAKDAREWAKEKGVDDLARNLMFSSSCATPGMNLAGKLIKPEANGSTKPVISSLVSSLSAKVPEAFDVPVDNSEQKATPDTDLVDAK